MVIGTGTLLKSVFIILFALLPLQPGKAQTLVKLRFTLSSGGSSGTFSANSRQYYFQQSTGQQSVIGISQKHSYLLRQGFIQPLCVPIRTNMTETLPATIYPNPFSGHIIISFLKSTEDPLYVALFDINGKLVLSRKCLSAREIELDLTSLASSVYVIRVNTATRCFYSKIIKL